MKNNWHKRVSQERKLTFTQFDISIAFQPNENFGQPTIYNQARASCFLPAGVGSSIGFGIHKKQWIGLSANSAIIFIGNEKLVAVPVYANLGVSPKLGDNTRLTLQYGLGKSLAIGRGNLSGKYQKISLGIITNNVALLFVALDNHNYKTINIDNQITTIK